MVDLNALLIEALDCADDMMKQGLQQPQQVHQKGAGDFALDVDRTIEYAVKQILQASDIPVLGEEFAWQGGEAAERYWVVDPVDGTVNYSRQLPMFGVCLALVEHGQAVLAGMSFPMLQERYLARQGQGATLNGTPIQVAPISELSRAMAALGDFAVGEQAAEKNQLRLKLVNQLATQVLRVRMPGSAALQLAWLASGRVDICTVLSNKPWDVQAGVLIAREAGALVFDADGSEHSTASRYTLAATPRLKSALLSFFRESS